MDLSLNMNLDLSNTTVSSAIDLSDVSLIVDSSGNCVSITEPEPEPEPAVELAPESTIIPPIELEEDTSELDISGVTQDLMMEFINHPIVLNLYVNSEFPELVQLYKDHIQKHNLHVKNDPYPNSGFDLFVPEEFWSSPDRTSVMVNHQVKCEMVEEGRACGFFSFPRSSISKTPLMLANHTGIIDSGYRGYLFGAFRNTSNKSYKAEEGIRLLQICHPSLKPFSVRLILKEEDLSTTSRGSGGFGSTGA